MLRIYLARHGQDQDNLAGILNGQRDQPLTEKGLEQAHETAGKIKDLGLNFAKIYASPLQRAYETARILSVKIAGPIPEKEPLLIERDFGIMTGRNVSDIETTCSPDIIKAEKITYFLNPEGAETFPDLLNRAQALLNKIKQAHTDEDILLVTHGDFGKMIYAKYYDLDWKNVLTMFHFGNCELLLLSPDSPAEEAHVFQIVQHNS